MRKVPLNVVSPGMVLARSMYNVRGDRMLAAGVALTASTIESLRARGYRSVLIHDDLSDGIEYDELLSERVRTVTVRRLHDTFDRLSNATSALRGGDEATVSAGIRAGGLGRLVSREKLFEALWDAVEDIVDEVLSLRETAALANLQQGGESTLEHSVDMAATAVLIGKLVNLDRRSLEQVAMGALFHDVGKVFVDEAVLSKRGPLTGRERAHMQQHALWGYELMKAEGWGDILSRHVVFQHHERQDGTGYPRGLVGVNRIARTIEEDFDGGRILLLAEVSAVADVFDALTSDRPFRPAYCHDHAIAMLSEMSFTHLNADLVEAFLNATPMFPVGSEVRIITGELEGSTALVIRVDGSALTRPVVRVFLDSCGRPVRPFDLDLRHEPEIELVGIDGVGGELNAAQRAGAESVA